MRTLIHSLTDAIAHRLDDRDLFVALVQTSMDRLGLDAWDVAAALPVSLETVDRWRSGAGVPRPLMRAPVYRFFIRRLQIEIGHRRSKI